MFRFTLSVHHLIETTLQTLLLPPDRQYSHGKDTLNVYPPEQTDPFIMYCKATMLMSRVKNFCLRFRSLRYTGDPSVTLPDALIDMTSPRNSLTIRDTPAFVEITHILQAMKAYFPPSIKGVVKEGRLEVYTYCTWNLIHLYVSGLRELVIVLINPSQSANTSP